MHCCLRFDPLFTHSESDDWSCFLSRILAVRMFLIGPVEASPAIIFEAKGIRSSKRNSQSLNDRD